MSSERRLKGTAHEYRQRCASAPISGGVPDVDNRGMRRLAIHCQPASAIATQEVERWLEQEVQRLRAGTHHASVHLHRITATGSSGDVGTGWLIELDATSGDPLDRERVDVVLRDLRLLGLRPTLLGALENGDSPTGPPEAVAKGGGS